MSTESIFGGEGIQIANKMMQMSMERQKAIANNIANADTPGYTRLDINFEKQLAKAIGSKDMQALSNIKGRLEKDETDPARIDGNNVVLPKEMNAMMQNNILYNLLTKAYSTRMRILKSAIKSR